MFNDTKLLEKNKNNHDKEYGEVITFIHNVQEKALDKLKINFSKLTQGEIANLFKKFDYTPYEYVQIDDLIPICDTMTDKEIFEIITNAEDKEVENEEPISNITNKKGRDSFE